MPGLERVQSITSRGSVEIDLFFSWKVDMFQTLELVNAALARVQSSLPATAAVTSNRLTFAAFPILGYSLTSDNVPQTAAVGDGHVRDQAALEPVERSVDRRGAGRPGAGISRSSPIPPSCCRPRVTVPALLEAVRRSNMIDSPGLMESNHQLVLSLVSGQVHTPEEIAQHRGEDHAGGHSGSHRRSRARCESSVKPVYTIVRANGKPAVLLNINRQPDSNTVQVADAVHAEIDSIRKTLPKGVTWRRSTISPSW